MADQRNPLLKDDEKFPSSEDIEPLRRRLYEAEGISGYKSMVESKPIAIRPRQPVQPNNETTTPIVGGTMPPTMQGGQQPSTGGQSTPTDPPSLTNSFIQNKPRPSSSKEKEPDEQNNFENNSGNISANKQATNTVLNHSLGQITQHFHQLAAGENQQEPALGVSPRPGL